MSKEAELGQVPTLSVTLLGCPNSGKTTLINALTGKSGKVANYAGVTTNIQKFETVTDDGNRWQWVDTPGVYSLSGESQRQGEIRKAVEIELANSPDLIMVVLDGCQLQAHLGLALEALSKGLPTLIVLNKADEWQAKGKLTLNIKQLQKLLNAPVIAISALTGQGLKALMQKAMGMVKKGSKDVSSSTLIASSQSLANRVDSIASQVLVDQEPSYLGKTPDLIDKFLLHPVSGSIILFGILAGIFQLAFVASGPPQDYIAAIFDDLASYLATTLGDAWWAALLHEGVVSGVGAVVTFLPPILLISLAILLLEQSGILARVALLCDSVMRTLGVGGYGLFPLLSGLTCALPAIAATRSIEEKTPKLICISIIPLIPCSARAPVYALVTAAFIPDENFWGLSIQGLVFFGFYFLGLLSAVVFAAIVAAWASVKAAPTPIELPKWQWPQLTKLADSLWHRAWIYIRNAGYIIVAASVILWLFAAIEVNPDAGPPGSLEASLVGFLGGLLHPLVAPLGFDWELAVALIPGLWAREVVVGILAVVYSVGGEGEGGALSALLAQKWTLAQGMSLGIWYVYAPQCLATFAMIKSETGSWKFSAGIAGVLLVAGWVLAFITYQSFLLLGLG